MIDFPRIQLTDLRTRYPGLFDEAQYVGVGVGWLPTIEEFLKTATALVAPWQGTSPGFSGAVIRVDEMTEKMGQLRMSVFLEGLPQEIVDYVRYAQILAHERTGFRCEVCGRRARRVTIPEGSQGWLQARCDEHMSEEQRAWPEPTRNVHRPYRGRWLVYDQHADVLIEKETR